jgi:glycosyltransferase involved in cell wall biosynthesis
MRSDLQFLAPAPGADGGESAYRVTVIVCTRDRPRLLEQCLGALSAQTYPDFDVLVVDNAPAGAVREICARWSATWVPAPVPGLTVARNLGARVARGEVIAYIDDDAIAETGWLEALVAAFDDPAVAAVSGGVRYMKAVGDTRNISIEDTAEVFSRAGRSFDSGTRNWFALACFGGIGDGMNMAFRRELIASSVAFDERLGRGRILDCGDEHIVFASLIASGHRIAHSPAAIVRHPCPPTPILLQARQFHDLRSTIAYVMFVWGKFPGHRADLLRFLGRAVAKRILPQRGAVPQNRRLPRLRAVRAILAGPFVFWRARREWAAVPAQRREGVVDPAPGFVAPPSGSR